jgi:PKD repeat protein
MKLVQALSPVARTRLAFGLTVALSTGWTGCGLDKVTVPPLSGPAETAVSIALSAHPDVITADGYSTVSAQAVLRNTAGQPIPGQAVYFAIQNQDGVFVDIGTLSTTTAVTNGNGIAQVIYTAPPRTDATGHQRVMIAARPIAGDSLGQFYRTVSIDLRSAEPILFPGNAADPHCSFVVEPGTGVLSLGQDMLAQSTSAAVPPDVIIRYEWDLGDGESTDDKPDIVHRYGFTGVYSLVHVVTTRNGGQATCSRAITVR